jgi:hypothetical protein
VELDRLSEAEAALLPAGEGLQVVRDKGPQACKALLLAQVCGWVRREERKGVDGNGTADGVGLDGVGPHTHT